MRSRTRDSIPPATDWKRKHFLGPANWHLGLENWIEFCCCGDSEWSVQPRTACPPAVDSPGVGPLNNCCRSNARDGESGSNDAHWWRVALRFPELPQTDHRPTRRAHYMHREETLTATAVAGRSSGTATCPHHVAGRAESEALYPSIDTSV